MNREAEHADRPTTGVGTRRIPWTLEEIVAVVAGEILVLAGIAGILRSNLGDALKTIPSGLAFLGVAVCAADGRRARVRAAGLNGIDCVEVSEDRVHLCLHFIAGVPGASAYTCPDGDFRVPDRRAALVL